MNMKKTVLAAAMCGVLAAMVARGLAGERLALPLDLC